MITVTSIIDSLVPQKNWKEIAKKHAKKHGETPQYWEDKWKLKSESSKEAGLIVHSTMEEDLKKNGFILEGNRFIVKAFDKTGGDPVVKLENNCSYPELSIHDKDSNVYGRVDNVYVKNRKIYITDTKTDEKIEMRAFTNEWVKAEKLLSPCSHLDNCNYNIYSLKLSMYMYILWKQNPNFRVGDLILNHISIKRDSDGIPILENNIPVITNAKRINLLYRKEEVKKILNDTKNI